MKRLSNSFVNRLIVLAFLLAPIVYLFAILINGLIGSHGTFDIGTTDLFQNFFPSDNWVSNLGSYVIANGDESYGFAPFAVLLTYVDDNMLHIASTTWGALIYGYLYWAFHVLLMDVVAYVSMFVFRMFKRIVDTLEGDMK